MLKRSGGQSCRESWQTRSQQQ